MNTYEVNSFPNRKDIEIKISDFANAVYTEMDHELMIADSKSAAESVFTRFLSGEEGLFAKYEEAVKPGEFDATKDEFINKVYSIEELSALKLNMVGMLEMLKNANNKFAIDNYAEYYRKLEKIIEITDSSLNRLDIESKIAA